MSNIRKAQIQAYTAQLALAYALNREANKAEEDSPVIAEWQTASGILNDMLLAGYAPRRWGMGIAAEIETGDETPEQIEELDGMEY